MVTHHKNNDIELSIISAIRNHSADKAVVYKEVFGEPVCLGYYLPKEYSCSSRYPVFIFVHGGSWSSHKIFPDQTCWQGDYLGYLARYYAEKGFVCVSIDYRLVRDQGQAENYGVIDCYEDCCDAMDYIIAHADEYGIDTQQMYLLGESAGGHLAGSLAMFHYDRIYDFQKVFLVNPVTYLYDKWKIRVPVNSSHPRLAGLSVEERAEFLSPLYQVRDDICELILIHGEDDTTVYPEHSIRLYERMQEKGCKCELHLIEKTKHAFLLPEYYKDGIEACKIAIGIINHKLKL